MTDLSTLQAMGGVRNESFVVGGARYALSPSWSLGARIGMQWDTDLGPRLRDSTLSGTYLAVNRSDFVVRIRPGISLPTGTSPQGLGVLPGASKSVDPRIGGDVVYGGTWLVSLSVDARVPIYEGPDERRQGSFGSVGVRGARRISDKAVPWLGISAVGATQDSRGSGDFGEVSVVAGSVYNINEFWSLNAQLRAPVWTSTNALPYAFAAGLGVARVIEFGGEEEMDDGHHAGDGHGH